MQNKKVIHIEMDENNIISVQMGGFSLFEAAGVTEFLNRKIVMDLLKTSSSFQNVENVVPFLVVKPPEDVS